jgi:hypothetical protein
MNIGITPLKRTKLFSPGSANRGPSAQRTGCYAPIKARRLPWVFGASELTVLFRFNFPANMS